ncbi:unnamed protein product, partial [Rotaria sp. Silwood2]
SCRTGCSRGTGGASRTRGARCCCCCCSCRTGCSRGTGGASRTRGTTSAGASCCCCSCSYRSTKSKFLLVLVVVTPIIEEFFCTAYNSIYLPVSIAVDRPKITPRAIPSAIQ